MSLDPDKRFDPSRGHGAPRGGGGGFKGGKQVIIEPHRCAGVFIARGKEDALVTKNLVPGSEVYGEKRISVENDGEKVEYRVWNPFHSKLAAAIMGGLNAIHMLPGSRVLYLGAVSGTTVSHVSDVVGLEGLVYAVEFSPRSGRDLINVAKKRTNIMSDAGNMARATRVAELTGVKLAAKSWRYALGTGPTAG